jgi:hypothetical protein
VLRIDGVGVRGDEDVLSAGGRRLGLRLVNLSKDDRPLLNMLERLHQNTRIERKLGPERARKCRLIGFEIGGLAPTLRSLKMSKDVVVTFWPKKLMDRVRPTLFEDSLS